MTVSVRYSLLPAGGRLGFSSGAASKPYSTTRYRPGGVRASSHGQAGGNHGNAARSFPTVGASDHRVPGPLGVS
ncbi:unnamed protein product [Arctogadus glacialis]